MSTEWNLEWTRLNLSRYVIVTCSGNKISRKKKVTAIDPLRSSLLNVNQKRAFVVRITIYIFLCKCSKAFSHIQLRKVILSTVYLPSLIDIHFFCTFPYQLSTARP